MNFTHLHLHTEFSLLDGCCKIEDIFEKCHSLGQTAVAITDHGNMFGVFEFYQKACKFSNKNLDPLEFHKKGGQFKVKPIIGCEVYIVDDRKARGSVGGKQPKNNHLILLAKNKTGYSNLVKLVSIGYKEGMYYKPRIDFEVLTKHSEGLICLSACLGGRLPQLLLNEQYDEAEKEALRHKQIFGDDYYIELQNHNISEQKRIIPHLVKIARDNHIKLVATNDCHYTEKKHSEMHKVLRCIGYRTNINELDEKNEEKGDAFPTPEFYIKSYEEMQELFGNFPDAITNTMEIADKCDCNFFEKEQLLPAYVPPKEFTPAEYLRHITYEGLKTKLKLTPDQKLPQERIDRLEYELDTIIRLGFVDYFLVVWDFIHYSEQNNIPVGPGRGSGAGSLVAYSIGITKLDPLKYNLYFERFLNSERVSNPDFDIDFCVVKRDKVIDYVTNKYGKDNVAQIVTFGTLAAKAAIKDCGRVYSIPYYETDKITKVMPKIVKAPIAELAGLKKSKKGDSNVCVDLKNMYDSEETVKKIVNMAIQIEGLPRQTGIHAAGVVICKDNLDEHVPVMQTSDNIIATQFDMIECEQLGLLKMDFLGLNTLTDIDATLTLIKETTGETIDFYNMEYDDPGVYKMIGEADTHGIFQLESGGMKSFLRELKPTCLEDIIAGISLYRPGPMDEIPRYVKGKRDAQNVQYAHPLLEPILNVTYGVIVYQEQVMQIVREIGGYTLGRADIVRRLMSKKKEEEMIREKDVFLNGTPDGIISGAIKKGVSAEIASKLFDGMISFASYAFNKSHAAAYAYLTYQTAYLKRHYPKEFFTSMLNNRITHIEEISNYLNYVKERGIKIYPPCVNHSQSRFTVEKDGIRVGMGAIKNVGVGFIEELVKVRNSSGNFVDFEDFVTRLSSSGINKKNLESMINSGCFDIFHINRPTLMRSFEQVMSYASIDKQASSIGQVTLFDVAPTIKQKFEYTIVNDYSPLQKFKNEKEASGVYLTGHPLDEFLDILKTFPYNSTHFSTISQDLMQDDQNLDEDKDTIKDGSKVVLGGMLSSVAQKLTKTNKNMGIAKLEDMYGSVEVMLSPNNYNELKPQFIEGNFVKITGKVNEREGMYTIWIEKIEQLDSSIQSQITPTIQPTATPNSKQTKQPKLIEPFIAVKVNFSDTQLKEEILNTLTAYEGEQKAFVQDLDTMQKYSLPTVNLCNALIAELNSIVGKDNVIVSAR